MKDRAIIESLTCDRDGNLMRITKEKFEELIELDPCLYWYEDVDEYYRNRQKERKTPAVKVSFVYNYKPEPIFPELHGTYISGKISIKINNETDNGLMKIEELVSKFKGTVRYL